MKAPFFSLVMPVYNAMPYLEQAIESIICQDFESIEFIIIDDGSTDNSLDFLLQVKDPRIKIIINKQNLGMTFSLNKGISNATGNYITRLDADDISTENRFMLQFEYLKENKHIKLLGGNANVIDESNNIVRSSNKMQYCNEELKWLLFFINPFIHSTTTFSREILTNNNLKYLNHSGADDYKLWTEISKFGEIQIIPEEFCKYRIHGNNMTITKQNEMKEAHILISNEYMQFFNFKFSLIETTEMINLFKRRSNNIEKARLPYSIKNYFNLIKTFSNTISNNKSINKEIEKILSQTKDLSIREKIKIIFLNRDLIFQTLATKIKNRL